MGIKKVVASLVRKHGTNNPFKLCVLLNIAVLYNDLGSVRGIYQYKYRKKIIHINQNLPEIDRRQVCAHELGHAILHRRVNTIFLDFYTMLLSDKLEIEANRFAAELLISDSDLEDPIFYEGLHIKQVAAALEVSELLLEYKLKW